MIPGIITATCQDYGNHLLSWVGNPKLGCVLHFDGPLNAERMARAVRLTLDAEPVLGCAFVEDRRRPYWRRLDNLDECSFFRVVESDRPLEDTLAFLGEPMDDLARPQVTAALIRASDGDEVALKVTHTVTDARGTKEYAYLLASIYNRLGENPEWCPKPNLAPRVTPRDLWKQLTFRQKWLSTFIPQSGSKNISPWMLNAIGSGHRDPSFKFLRIPPERFARIKDYTHRRQATINDIMYTAFYRGLFHVLNPEYDIPLSVIVTADLRRYLPGGTAPSIGSLSTLTFGALTRVRNEDFDGTLDRVKAQLDSWKHTSFGAGSAYILHLTYKAGHTNIKRILDRVIRIAGPGGRTLPSFTNFGVLDADLLSFGSVRPTAAFMVAPVPYGNGILLNLCTYQNILTAAIGFYRSDMDPAFYEQLLEVVDHELPA